MVLGFMVRASLSVVGQLVKMRPSILPSARDHVATHYNKALLPLFRLHQPKAGSIPAASTNLSLCQEVPPCAYV